MRHWVLLALAGCGGSSTVAEPFTVSDAALDVVGDPLDAGTPNAAEASADAVSASDAVDGAVDAGPRCTPPTRTPAPTSCACFAASACPHDAGAGACLWGEAPLTANGNPTCRGCTLSAFASTCGRCAETWNCACLAPYLAAVGSTSTCCDTSTGPFVTEYSCP